MGDRITPLVTPLVAVLFPACSHGKTSPACRAVTRKSIATLSLHPSPFVFAHTLTAFLHEFNKCHWLSTEAIEHVLETLIRVAVDKHSYQPQLSCALLTHVRNSISDSSLFSDSLSSQCCVFTPSVGMEKARLSLGSEQVARQFVNKCHILERQLGFALSTLKYQNSFESCHPCQFLFERDLDNLLCVVEFCVKHERGGAAQVLQSELSAGVFKNAAAVKHLFCSEAEAEGRAVPRLLQLVLACLQQLTSPHVASGRSGGGRGGVEPGCAALLVVDRVLQALRRVDSSQHCRSGSTLAPKLREMLLLCLAAATHWALGADAPGSQGSEGSSSTPLRVSSVLFGLSPDSLGQLCSYVGSAHRGTQHLSGAVLLLLLQAEEEARGVVAGMVAGMMGGAGAGAGAVGARPPSRLLTGAAVAAHGARLPLLLARSTVFNLLVRVDTKAGRHNLSTILAWDLQVR